jgi:type IV pilus assembly protein PilQ
VCAALALAFGAAADGQARLLGVRAGGDDRTSGVVITADRPLSFTTLKLLSPPRVVVDFAETEVAAEARELEIEDGTLRRAAVAQAGSRTARVVIELTADAEFDIRTDGNEIEVRVPRPAAVAAAPRPEGEAEAEKVASLPKVSLVGSKSAVPPESEDPDTERPRTVAEKAEALKKALAEQRAAAAQRRQKPAPPPPARIATSPVVLPPRTANPVGVPPKTITPATKMTVSQGHHITGIGFRPVRGGEVIVRSDHPLEYGISGDDRAVLLHLPSAAIPLLNNRRPLDTQFFDGPVRRVVPLSVAGGTDVRIELREHAEYQLAQAGSVLTVTFSARR